MANPSECRLCEQIGKTYSASFLMSVYNINRNITEILGIPVKMLIHSGIKITLVSQKKWPPITNKLTY